MTLRRYPQAGPETQTTRGSADAGRGLPLGVIVPPVTDSCNNFILARVKNQFLIKNDVENITYP
ncbi:hypothetical protein J2S74_001943 [Evansella vedderi]|uniref:Uncharacterized protein n=1 Tax=Evansella vedderi TaxID=38282 RepID=A0ABT9ZTJ4_9BACI|nr:hypothetical protein [Evansella vedderi]